MHEYEFLAEWFEYLNDDCGYEAWSQYFIQGLKARNAGTKGFELGCGSGAFSRALTRAGYSMTGGDVSTAMLSKAARLAREEGLSVPFVLADACSWRGPEKYDFILSANDCFNYISPERIPCALKCAAKNLKKGGILWFDVSSEYKLREKVANNMFGDDRDDVTYLEFNRLEGDRVVTDVTLFVREGGLFRRHDERHTRYIHTQSFLESCIAAAGFCFETEGHLGESARQTDRLNFICKKVIF